MKIDKEIGAKAGVIWAIIGVVVSALLVLVAFSIDELSVEVRILSFALLGFSLISLLTNLKVKKHINAKDKLDDR